MNFKFGTEKSEELLLGKCAASRILIFTFLSSPIVYFYRSGDCLESGCGRFIASYPPFLARCNADGAVGS